LQDVNLDSAEADGQEALTAEALQSLVASSPYLSFHCVFTVMSKAEVEEEARGGFLWPERSRCDLIMIAVAAAAASPTSAASPAEAGAAGAGLSPGIVSAAESAGHSSDAYTSSDAIRSEYEEILTLLTTGAEEEDRRLSNVPVILVMDHHAAVSCSPPAMSAASSSHASASLDIFDILYRPFSSLQLCQVIASTLQDCHYRLLSLAPSPPASPSSLPSLSVSLTQAAAEGGDDEI